VTPLANVEDAEVTGPYLPFKVIGPHISLADRGVTFGTTWRRGVCVRFREPVPAALPGGLLPHPGATVTVADADRLAAVLRQRAADDRGSGVAPVPEPVPEEAGLVEVTATPDVAAPAPAPVSRRPLKRTTTRTTRTATPSSSSSSSPAPATAPTSTRTRRPTTRRSSRTATGEHPTPADMPQHTSTEKAAGVTPPADGDLPGPDAAGS
jgi:hypothetical protein